MITKRWSWAQDAVILFAGITIFCLKFYHNHFIFQGDVFLNLYLHTNAALFRLGWDPHTCGYLGWYPVFGGMFPFNAIMHLITGGIFGNSPYAVFYLLEINACLSLFLLAFLTYALLRYLGRSRAGALLGGFIISMTGFHIQTGIREFDLFYLHSFIAVPLSYIFLIKAERQRDIRWALAAGLTVGISLLGGSNIPMLMYLPGFFFIYTIGESSGSIFSRNGFMRSSRFAAVALGVAAFVAAAMLIPSFAYMRLTMRDTYMYSSFSAVSPPPYYTFLTMLYRDWWPRYRIPLNMGHYHEFDAFLGLPVLLLVILGIMRPGRQTKAKWCMLIIAAGALFTMHLGILPDFLVKPFSRILAFGSVRFPYRFFMGLLLPAAFFAACGLDNILQRMRHIKNVIAAGLMVVLGVAYCAGGIVLFTRYTIFEARTALFFVMLLSAIFLGLLSLVYTGTCSRTRWSESIFKWSALGCVFLIYYASLLDCRVRFNYRSREPPEASVETVNTTMDILYKRNTQVYKYFKEHLKRGPFRIYNPGSVLRNNIAAYREDIDIAFEPMYPPDPAAPRSLARYFWCIEDADSPLLDLYNIVIQRHHEYTGTKLVPTSSAMFYYNPYAFRRFFIVHNAILFSSEDAMWDMLCRASRDELAQIAFLLKADVGKEEPVAGSAEGIQADGVDIIERAPGRIVLNAVSPACGYLIASELWFPAWTAKVDGKRQKLLRAYGTFWAVRIGAGEHRIVFEFFDWYTFIGKLISVASIIIILPFIFRRRPSTRRGTAG